MAVGVVVEEKDESGEDVDMLGEEGIGGKVGGDWLYVSNHANVGV